MLHWIWLGIITTVAAVASAVVTFVAPTVYVLGYPEITIQNYTISLVANMFLIAIIYFAASVLDAVTPSTPTTNTIGKITSRLAFISVGITAGIVIVQLYNRGDNIQQIFSTPGPMQILIGLVVIAVLDVFVLQRIKDKGLPSGSGTVGHRYSLSQGGMTINIFAGEKNFRVIPPVTHDGMPQVEAIDPPAKLRAVP